MDSLVPDRDETGLGRRGVVTGALGVGFAAAALPVMAQSVITTPADGLESGEVKVKSGDTEFPAYRAVPAAPGKYPTILVVQEIFGVHEHIRDVCRRLAKQGAYAIAPELYARQGDPSKIADVPTLLRDVVAKVPDDQVMADLDATAAFAAASGKGDAGRLGITGFCWGGRIVWLYAAHNPALKAGVAWYGRLVGQATPLTPRHPVELAAHLKAPVLGLYGGADTGIPLDTVEQMRSGVKAANGKSEIVVYPEAPHAFNADYRPSYRKEAAEDGWKRMTEWFKSNGVL